MKLGESTLFYNSTDEHLQVTGKVVLKDSLMVQGDDIVTKLSDIIQQQEHLNLVVDPEFKHWLIGHPNNNSECGFITSLVTNYGSVPGNGNQNFIRETNDLPSTINGYTPSGALGMRTKVISTGDFHTVNFFMSYDMIRSADSMPMTVSCWVKFTPDATSSLTPPYTFTMTLRNKAVSRYFSHEVQIQAADTWQYVSFPVTMDDVGSDPIGWGEGSNWSVVLLLVLHAPSSLAAEDEWTSGSEFASANQDNLNDAIGNVFKIAMPQVAIGDPVFRPPTDMVTNYLVNARVGSVMHSGTMMIAISDTEVTIVGQWIVPKHCDIRVWRVLHEDVMIRDIVTNTLYTSSSPSVSSKVADSTGYRFRIGGFVGLTAGQQYVIDAASVDSIAVFWQ